jgi:hypothetical protein
VSHFYRYYRPVRFDQKRNLLITLPKGGICLRFETIDGSNQLLWSYSRCHPDDHFNKDVAKILADDRARVDLSDDRVSKGKGTVTYEADPFLLAYAVARRCSEWEPGETAPIIARYLKDDLEGLGTAIKSIVDNNESERAKMFDWDKLVAALHLAAGYARRA